MNDNEIRALRREMVTMALRAGVGADAEDLVQDCLVALVRAEARVARSYAFGALYRRIALHWRRHHRRGALQVSDLFAWESASWPEVDHLQDVLRLDGALAVLADGELPGDLLVWSPAAPFWASEVVDAIEKLLDELGCAGQVSERHSRRLRAGWVRSLREASEKVKVELVTALPECSVESRVQVRGADPDADRQELQRRCDVLRGRGRSGRRSAGSENGHKA